MFWKHLKRFSTHQERKPRIVFIIFGLAQVDGQTDKAYEEAQNSDGDEEFGLALNTASHRRYSDHYAEIFGALFRRNEVDGLRPVNGIKSSGIAGQSDSSWAASYFNELGDCQIKLRTVVSQQNRISQQKMQLFFDLPKGVGRFHMPCCCHSFWTGDSDARSGFVTAGDGERKNSEYLESTPKECPR